MSTTDVTGPVLYEKIVCPINGRSIDVHFFGDDHQKVTSCKNDDSETWLSFLDETFSNKEIGHIDVFAELGKGFIVSNPKSYLTQLIADLQNQKKCLVEEKKCQYPTTDFYSIDFRHKLYIDYTEVVDYWYYLNKNSITQKKPYEDLPSSLSRYSSLFKRGEKLPYPHTSDIVREALRLEWIKDMISIRKQRYKNTSDPTGDLGIAGNLGDFIGDLYYLFTFYNSPYYIYLLQTEINLIHPSCINFKEPIEEYINHIFNDIKLSLTPEAMRSSQFIQIAVSKTSWLMDIYACITLLQEQRTHVVMILGVNHVEQIKTILANIGIQILPGIPKKFNNPSENTNNGIQCISIPVQDGHLILGSDELLENVVPIYPNYRNIYQGTRSPRRTRLHKKSLSRSPRRTRLHKKSPSRSPRRTRLHKSLSRQSSRRMLDFYD